METGGTKQKKNRTEREEVKQEKKRRDERKLSISTIEELLERGRDIVDILAGQLDEEIQSKVMVHGVDAFKALIRLLMAVTGAKEKGNKYENGDYGNNNARDTRFDNRWTIKERNYNIYNKTDKRVEDRMQEKWN
ncbi:hypothetical protein FQA39_LY19107 [Lamprigera yunnana]|nr:hypothetical protein FQA39_LY19107 [Lamprigera yunnana]